MRIQIDTDQKTIKIEKNALLKDVIKTLNKLLPNGEWKEFTLETNATISHWCSHYPWSYYAGGIALSTDKMNVPYTLTMSSTQNALSMNSGVYNIEA